MSMVIQSFDNLHDNRVLRYCADFEAHTLHMDTRTEAGENVSVHFTGLLAHWFENVIQDNILFGMDEITAAVFFISTQKCWTGLSLTAFLPAAASRNCGSAGIRSVFIGTPYLVWYCHKSSRFHKAMRH